MQHSVDLLIQAATDDPAECFVPSRQDATANGANTGTSKTLDVESAKFFVVRATAESIELLSEYLKVVINLELVVTDVMGRIIEFLKVSSRGAVALMPVVQLAHVPGCSRRGGDAVCGTEEHHGQASR